VKLGDTMVTNKQNKGPKFVSYFQPVIDALIEIGGSGRPSEVKDLISESLNISDEELGAQINSGASRFSKNVDWARFYLAYSARSFGKRCGESLRDHFKTAPGFFLPEVLLVHGLVLVPARSLEYLQKKMAGRSRQHLPESSLGVG